MSYRVMISTLTGQYFLTGQPEQMMTSRRVKVIDQYFALATPSCSVFRGEAC